MERLERTLKDHHLRMTTARKAIFSILEKSPKALTPQEVCQHLDRKSPRGSNADQASVYRNLTLFSEIGLAHQVQLGRYSLCTHNESDHHKHIHIMAMCSDCGNTIEAKEHSHDLCELAGQFKKYMKGFGSFSGLTLEGICRDCSN